MKSLRQLHRFEFRHDGAFLAYLRKSIRHRIVDEIRRAHRRPALISLSGLESIDWAVSPLERLIAKSHMRHYKDQLAKLSDRDRPLDRLAGGARAVVQMSRRVSACARSRRRGWQLRAPYDDWAQKRKVSRRRMLRVHPTAPSAIGLADAVEIHSRMAGGGDTPRAGVRAASWDARRPGSSRAGSCACPRRVCLSSRAGGTRRPARICRRNTGDGAAHT